MDIAGWWEEGRASLEARLSDQAQQVPVTASPEKIVADGVAAEVTPAASSRTLITTTLGAKCFIPGRYGDDRIDMDFTLTLTSESRPSRAVKGKLIFTDLFGDTGFEIGYTVNDPLAAGVPFAAKGVGFDFNQFMSDHNWMLGTDLNDMKVYFEIRSVLFQDGSTHTY